MERGTLVLLPNLLGPWKEAENVLPKSVWEAVSLLDGLIAESPQKGRSYLHHFRTKLPPNQIPLAVFNEHTPKEDIDFFLKPVQEGGRWGVVSDAGLPGIADPADKLVFRARQLNLKVEALVGPSSLMQALLLSGLPAQRFSFHGYPPKDPERCKQCIASWQRQGAKEKATQMLIEAPYRNNALFQRLLEVLLPTTYLCVASDLTMDEERVLTYTVGAWRKMPAPQLEKRPSLFLFFAD